ncbi:MAG TPA: hypothetical protein VHD83_03775, partial [Puia sp.]|nr:hypothetical protein [Puia sp.]
MDNLLMDILMKSSFNYPLSIDNVNLQELEHHRVQMDVLRLDKIHPVISGNKWFKLKEYLSIAVTEGRRHLVTFGGAWSNHIIATAAACKQNNFTS